MVELDKEQEKVFVNEMMEANELKGASKKRLIKFLGNKYDWDKHRVQFRLTLALIAERYAAYARSFVWHRHVLALQRVVSGKGVMQLFEYIL